MALVMQNGAAYEHVLDTSINEKTGIEWLNGGGEGF
jgi:hypothetical protein